MLYAPIRVVILHQNRLFRESLAFALNHQPNISVIRTATEPAELWPVLGDVDPRVFVVDLDLPRRTGLAHTREIAQVRPSAGILMIGVSEVAADVIGACEAGATGYLRQDASLNEIIDHVRAIATGETPCSPKVAALLFGRLRERARELQRMHAADGVRLSPREIEIIGLIAQRLSNKEIAVRLGIGVQTVKNHVHNILEKLDLHDRFAAVDYAREHGLLALQLLPAPVPTLGARRAGYEIAVSHASADPTRY